MLRPVFAAFLLSAMALVGTVPAHADSVRLTSAILKDQKLVEHFDGDGGGLNVPNYGVSLSPDIYGLKPVCGAGPSVGHCLPGSTGFPSNADRIPGAINLSATARPITLSGLAIGTGQPDIALESSTTAIPEASTFILLGMGLAFTFIGKTRQLWIRKID